MVEKGNLILEFTEIELKNKQIIKKLNELVDLKIKLQRNKFYTISPVEFKLISTRHTYVPLRKYKKKMFSGEVGKYNGKRVVIKNGKSRDTKSS